MKRVIGIGGTSRSGKSTLSEKLGEILERTVILHQDEFNAEELPLIKDHVDWEIPESVNYTGIIEEIGRLSLAYENIIVEGILIFSDFRLNKMFTHRIFLELDWETFRTRKESDLRWGREPDWYIRHIWDSYVRYSKFKHHETALHINAKDPIDIEDVLNYIRSAE